MSRLRLLLLPLLALTQCTPPPAAPTGQTRSDAATLAACREHADAAYNRNNRDSIYTIGNRDSPFSGNYGPAPVDKGLSQRYGRESMIRDCVRNTGTACCGNRRWNSRPNRLRNRDRCSVRSIAPVSTCAISPCTDRYCP